jgi:hypothetical protein
VGQAQHSRRLKLPGHLFIGSIRRMNFGVAS